MDLHTFEPDGTHLSYQNLNGITGTLDVDDTSSYGSENYLVGSDDVMAGEHAIGIK
jgi:uncharacterized protein YfaP (DUF2135 family)|tara:strand:+ start:1217 stop:1384 length:168 start_codon:yes stop_codon:yes gene_type:complete